MTHKVRVVNLPGYVSEFRATVVEGFERIPGLDGRGDLAVVTTEVNDFHVVPVGNLEDDNE